MHDEPFKILLVEDTPDDARRVQEALKSTKTARFKIIRAERLEEALKYLDKEKELPDAVLLDLSLPDSQGLNTFTRLNDKAPRVPIILLTGIESEALAIKAVRSGAQDYLVKWKLEMSQLARVLRYAIERKRIGEALLESESKYHSLVETMAEGLAVLDEKGIITLANYSMYKLLGRTIEEMVGLSIYEFIDKNYWKDMKERLSKRQEGMSDPLEIELTTNGNRNIWVLVSPTSLFDIDGDFIGSLVTFTDINLLKRTEGALRRRTSDLLERVKELNCLYSVSKLLTEIDRSIEEVSQKVVDTIPPSCQYPEITCARITLEGKEFKTSNFKEAFWRMSTDITIDGKKMGKIELHYLEDMPEAHEGSLLEDERRLIDTLTRMLGEFIRRKQAEEHKRLAMLGRVAGSVVHDISNPLHYVRGTAELLFNMVKEGEQSPDELLFMLETVLQGCDQINETCNRLRRISGRRDVRPFDLCEAMNTAITITRNWWEAACENVTTAYDIEKPVLVKGVESDITHVFMNLLVNAAQAIENTGEITVRIYKAPDQKHAVTEVMDTGCGIPPMILEKIGKEVITTKTIEEGTGIGLLNAYSTIQQYGGNIEVHSTVKKGTTFTIKLPIHKQ
ncbi:MAG: ATP-binding protein [Candidatus Hodarchaeales archaeon]